jgi:hypothetical protein
MKNLFAIVLAIVFGLSTVCASAQVLPQISDMQSRIPAPLPPPPVPPTINGSGVQGPPPGVIAPVPLNTFSDRVGRCLQEGSNAGLNMPDLNAFTGSCVNAN